jgi:Terminase large subunit gpA, endonuclease domain
MVKKQGGAEYERHKEKVRQRHEAIARKGRDIAPLPAIANVRRRSRCRKSLRLFCETYNPEAFSLAWSADHLKAIARIEEAATHGALYAYAMPRGSGKTTIARMAALWSISYGLRRYVFLIGANADKAQDSLAAIKMCIRFLPLYAEDFPEISHAVRCLGGIANRASGQLCNEDPTLIEWGKDRIVLPTVPPPPNWSRTWAKRADGLAPTSGSVISASGLTGDGIRGSLLTLSTGESIRPDLVLLDDPQTSESAASPVQNEKREQLVSADVLGMAGPGRTISAVMPCTVIRRNDFIDRILDRIKHPLWRGERTRMLRAMPSNLGEWDKYFEVYRHCAQLEPPDFAEANVYYVGRRQALDKGSEAAWPERKLPGEVSAIQHAMNLYCRDPRAFASEYQNDPLDVELSDLELTADEIAAKVNGLSAGVVPLWATRLTLGCDVQGQLLYWCVAAWKDDFTGHVVSYGTCPGQSRSYFSLRDANPTLTDATGRAGEEARVFAGLSLLLPLIDRGWDREDGQTLKIERALIDAGYQGEVVKQWIRGCGRTGVIASHGRYFGASAKPIPEWKSKPGQRKGHHWVLDKHVTFDTNVWKSFLQARLATSQPEAGCLTLFGDTRTNHRLFAEHLTAEHRTKVEARGRSVDEWKALIGRDNHWLDALVMATVGASVLGCSPQSIPRPKAGNRPKVSFKAMQDEARRNRDKR